MSIAPHFEQHLHDFSATKHLFDTLPHIPRCSDNKTATLTRPKKLAVNLPYMQVNPPKMVNWLVFDLDHSNNFIWKDKDLPAPNFVVINPKNGHSHLFYAIKSVCTSENARAKPIQFMRAIYQAWAQELCADPNYSGPVAKTPHHPWWRTAEIHSHVYELNELAESVELPPYFQKSIDLDVIPHSRHCYLFEMVRHYAYSVVNHFKQTASFKDFADEIFSYASNKNKFKERGFELDLNISQVRATVRSITRWTWDKYRGKGAATRIMNLPVDMSLKQKQQAAAVRTNTLRIETTEKKIRLAIKHLAAQNKKITQISVSKISGLTRQTIAKFKSLFNETLAVKNVNYGLHQITTFFKRILVPHNKIHFIDISLFPIIFTHYFIQNTVFTRRCSFITFRQRNLLTLDPPS